MYVLIVIDNNGTNSNVSQPKIAFSKQEAILMFLNWKENNPTHTIYLRKA